MSTSEKTGSVDTETAEPLAELERLLDDLRKTEEPFVQRLRDVLANAGGVRLETREDMKKFARMANAAADRLGAKIQEPKTGEPARLGVKSAGQNRYPAFSFKQGSRPSRGGSRKIPEMSITLDT